MKMRLTDRERISGWIYWLFQLLFLPSLLVLLNRALPVPLDLGWINGIYFTVNFLCMLLIFHRFLRQHLNYAAKNIWKCLRWAFFGFVVYQLSTYLIGLLILSLQPGFANPNDNSLAEMTQNRYWLMSLTTIFMVPITEECLYRGVIFGSLYPKSPVLAYSLSGCIFALVHVMGYIPQMEPLSFFLCLLQYIPAGLILAWIYRASGSICAPILLHMTVNQMGIFSMR